MVIVCVSVDRTRWDSIKITTHLNFVSDLGLTTASRERCDSMRNMNIMVDSQGNVVRCENSLNSPIQCS